MIKSIHISNYALIDTVDIELTDGLNIITGETGAGKSIMLGALSLLLGGKSDSSVVTDKERKSVIEAVFDINANKKITNFLENNNLDSSNDGILILRREIAPTGRSRAFINDSPVNIALLSELSKQLIDIHSQHQSLLLASEEFQLEIIDAMASNRDILEEYKKHYNEYKVALKKYSRIKKESESIHNMQDDLASQLARLESLDLQPGEQSELENEIESLENYTFIKENLFSILSKLSNEENASIDSIHSSLTESEEIKTLIPDGEQLFERLNSVYIELKDIIESYESIESDLVADPSRLEWVQNRLDNIYRHEKRYGVENSDQLIEIKENLANQILSVDSIDSKLAELQQEAKEKRSQVLSTAKRLSESRKIEAAKFMNLLREKAVPLGMQNIKAVADFSFKNELSATGIDNVEFKFAFNKNQELLPLNKTASGGEISRLMLCVKSILADRMQFPTIIFDEIDTGVSGEIADKMGNMMLEISELVQVVAITHLPQVASKGKAHFKVYKEDDEHKTNTRLSLLSNEERIKELAVMLSGSKVEEAAIANARSLLNK